MAVQPIINQWYHYPEKSQKFKVVALDLQDNTIEIQYFDGTVDEMEMVTWYGSRMEGVEAPEDWTGAMEYLEIDDRSSTGTEMSGEDWSAPYDEILEKENAGPIKSDDSVDEIDSQEEIGSSGMEHLQEDIEKLEEQHNQENIELLEENDSLERVD